MQKVLSIVIPVYNAERYLDYCLQSIFQNDLKNIEVIIIDDGSTDNSKYIIRKYENKSPYFRAYFQRNKGVSSARNLGLKHAKGKWIWFIDSDDLIFLNSIEYIKKIISNYKMDIFIFGYNNNPKKLSIIKNVKIKKIGKKDAIKSLLETKFATYPWNKIFKKSLFEKIKFPPNMVYTEDMYILYRLYDIADTFYIQVAPLYCYRLRQDSAVHTVSTKKLKDSAIAHYSLYSYVNHKFPEFRLKIEKETTISIIAFFHSIHLKEIKKYTSLVNFLIEETSLKNYDLRYKIELLSFKYNYFIFKLIGEVKLLKNKLIKLSRY